MLYLSLRAGQGGGEGGGRRWRPWDTPPGCAQRHTGWPQTAIAAGRGSPPGRQRRTRNAGRGRTRARPPKPQPPRGAAPRAQFPETQIPECTHPCIHSVHERASMFTQAGVFCASGKDSCAHIYTLKSTRGALHTGRAGHAWSPEQGIPDGHPRPILPLTDISGLASGTLQDLI